MSSSHPSKYGIHADYHQLLDAAKAFSEFSKVVHTLDLIILRRGQLGAKPVLSTITPPPRAALHTLPVEILLLVRQELLDLHLRAAPSSLFKEHINFFDDSAPGKDVDLDCDCSIGSWEPEYGECGCYERKLKAHEREVKRAAKRRDPAQWDDALWREHDSLECEYCSSLRFTTDFPLEKEKDLIGRLLRSRGLQLSTNTPDFLMNDYLFITGKGRARNYRVAVVLPPHSPITPHEDQKFARLARDFCLRLGSEFTVYVEEDRVDGEDGKAAGKKGAAKDASRRKVVQPAVLLQ